MTASSLLTRSGLLGYLTFVEFATHGMVGGYLLVDRHARPLEFHCTAPVCPTATHRILYGPTLRAVLCCDQIGLSLLKQTDSRPELLLTDEPDALALSQKSHIPTALLSAEGSTAGGSTAGGSTAEGSDGASPAGPSPRSLVFGGHLVTTSRAAQEDQETIERTLRQLGGEWDLSEPLDRIREAIQEAQRAAA